MKIAIFGRSAIGSDTDWLGAQTTEPWQAMTEGELNVFREGRIVAWADLHYTLVIDFLDAMNGATRRLTLPSGGSIDVAIPAGVREGQVIRLRGKGAPSRGEGPAGDALIELNIRLHRFFVLEGDDIRLELPVTLKEAVLGGRIKVPTPAGAVMMNVPRGSNTGTVLRLRRKGAPRKSGGHGDELVVLKVILPASPDHGLEELVSNWSPSTNDDLRREMLS